jgi:hypothetical protein
MIDNWEYLIKYIRDHLLICLMKLIIKIHLNVKTLLYLKTIIKIKKIFKLERKYKREKILKKIKKIVIVEFNKWYKNYLKKEKNARNMDNNQLIRKRRKEVLVIL